MATTIISDLERQAQVLSMLCRKLPSEQPTLFPDEFDAMKGLQRQDQVSKSESWIKSTFLSEAYGEIPSFKRLRSIEPAIQPQRQMLAAAVACKDEEVIKVSVDRLFEAFLNVSAYLAPQDFEDVICDLDPYGYQTYDS